MANLYKVWVLGSVRVALLLLYCFKDFGIFTSKSEARKYGTTSKRLVKKCFNFDSNVLLEILL